MSNVISLSNFNKTQKRKFTAMIAKIFRQQLILLNNTFSNNNDNNTNNNLNH